MSRVKRMVRRATPGFSWREWATLLVGIGVIIAMVVVAETARDDAENHLRAQVLVERVRAESQRLGAVNWQGLAGLNEGRKPQAIETQLVAAGSSAWNSLTTSLSALAKLEPGPTISRLEKEADMFTTVGERALSAVATGDIRRVVAVDSTAFRPALNAFDADAKAAAANQERIANQASSRGELLNVGSFVVGVALLVLLGWSLHRIRRQAVIASQQRALERRGEERIRALVEHSSDVISVIDSALTVRWQSSSVGRMLGYEPDGLIGRRLTELIHETDRTHAERVLDSATKRPGAATLSARFQHADGSWRHVEAIAENRLDDPAVRGVVLSLRDVTARKALEDELRHQAFHDSLTGLANRALFEDRLAHGLARARRDRRPIAVLFLDLDDFKTINDSLGHEVGDELLRAAAIRIAGIVRAADTAARLGGDEFAVLVEIMDHEDEPLAIAQRIREALTMPFRVNGRTLRASTSIGVALSDGTVGVQDLLRNADTAMYAAKDEGKNNVQAYEEGMHRRAVERLELTGELQQALELGQFELDYQPIVELDSGSIVGVEALVRWAHPERGRLAPIHFIGLAEETGLIVPMGTWILHTACAQASEWHRAFPERAPLEINVNVSTRQLHDPAFAQMVDDVLRQTRLEPSALVLEITESLLPDDGDGTVGQLEQLKALGVRIAVDDFGTGYSALSRLQHFPIDMVKIDRSFIAGMESDDGKSELVHGILNLGESLHLEVVAEGIEQPEQAQQLREMGSPLGQGFLFSRPITSDTVTLILKHGERLTEHPQPAPA